MADDAKKPREFAKGGVVTGPVRIFLPDNSYVIPARLVRKMDRHLLDRLNAREVSDD